MKTFVAIILALFCLAPAAQAGGHFRSVGYGHAHVGYGFRSYAPFYSYSLFVPFVPVYQVPVYQAAPVYQAPVCPEPVQAAPVYQSPVCPEVATAYAPAYSTGFAGYAGSYGYAYGRGLYGQRHFHRPPVTPPKARKVPRR